MKRIHFMGIGGSGASAIAAIAQAQGFEVSGCDLHPHNQFTKDFDSKTLFEKHSPNHLNNINILAISPAISALNPNNPELTTAYKKGIEVLTWQQFMGKYLEKNKFVIAICGTHGKSTTTAMTGLMLEDAGLDPTVELGTIVPKWDKNYRVGKSRYFVTEADEFNDNFLVSYPDITVVTNIEMDHPEYFTDWEAYKVSFRQFFNQTKLKIIANFSDPGVREVMEGFQKDKMDRNRLELFDYSKSEIHFDLKIPGEFNRLNAAAALQTGLSLEIDPTIIRQSLMAYSGIERRFELIGEYNPSTNSEHKGARIYSDFGHHPTEIKVTIEAARQKFPDDRLVVIFQPHMFSRTKALFGGFVEVLKNLPVDQVFVMDIYPSREVDTGLVSSKQLVEAVNKGTVSYLGSESEVENFLRVAIRAGDTVFFVGAGDIDQIARNIITPKHKG